MPSTTSSSKWAREFYAAVLDVNARLPAERKLRVLIGDPPIALVIYGDDHFQGRGFPANSITNLVERAGFKMITISPQYGGLIKHQPSVASWKTPSFAAIRNTSIGRRFYAQFYPMPPAPGWNRVLMQDQFDAVLYLSAKPPTMTIMPKNLCLDAGYMKMRMARLNAVAPAAADRLKKLCADLTR